MNNKTRRLIQRLTLTPYSVWAVLFIVVPLLFVAYYAFTDQSFRFTFDNITRFFTATSVIDNGETTREVHTYLVNANLEAFEWQQSHITEHIISAMKAFGLRMYQIPSSYDVKNRGHE